MNRLRKKAGLFMVLIVAFMALAFGAHNAQASGAYFLNCCKKDICPGYCKCSFGWVYEGEMGECLGLDCSSEEPCSLPGQNCCLFDSHIVE